MSTNLYDAELNRYNDILQKHKILQVSKMTIFKETFWALSWQFLIFLTIFDLLIRL